MASSKRSEKEIKDKRSQRFEYVGDKKVANELQEIEFQPSSLETIDRAMLRFIDEDLNLFTQTEMDEIIGSNVYVNNDEVSKNLFI